MLTLLSTSQLTEPLRSGKHCDLLKQTGPLALSAESESLELDVMLSFVDARRSAEDTHGDMSTCTENED